MNNRKLTIFSVLFLILFNLFPLFCLPGFEPWGQEVDDGSEIQVYWESIIQEKDFRIPQDLTLLETDEFHIYIRSQLFAEGELDHVTIRLFDYHIEEVAYWDAEINATRTRLEKVFDVIKDEITLNVSAGQNKWGDHRFGILLINHDTFPAFRNSNRTERVQVIFHDVIIEFDHWTNLAEIEITKTFGQFNAELMYWIAIASAIIVFFIYIASLIHRRAGTSPPPPSWYFWPMLISFAMGIVMIIILMMGMPFEAFSRYASVLPPVWIAVVVGIWLDFYLPNRFSGNVKPHVFFEVDGDTNVIVGIWPLWGYFKGDTLEFIDKKTSYREFVKRFFVGGYPQPDWIFRPKVPIVSKNKELPNVYAIKSFAKTPANLTFDVKWYIILLSFFILPVLAILPLLTRSANITTGVGSILVLALALGIFVFSSIRLTDPKLEIEQILHVSEAQALTNIHAITAMQEFVKESLTEHMDFVAKSEKNHLSNLKLSIKRFTNAYKGKTKENRLLSKEKEEKLEKLMEVFEWTKSKDLLEKLEISSDKKTQIKS